MNRAICGTWNFVDCFLVVNWDLWFVLGIAILYTFGWKKAKPRNLVKIEEKVLVFRSIKEAIVVLVSVTAILLPTSIALTVYILKGELNLSDSAIDAITYHLNFSIASYVASLFCATINLNRLPTEILKDYNLAYEKWTVTFAVLQGLTFTFATWRLLRAFWALF